MQKIPIWKNILLIFSLIVAIIIATLAWFYTDQRGYAGMDLDVGEASFIEVSSDYGENWSGDLSIDIGINKSFKEITGDGKTLFAPVYDIVENSEGVLTSKIIAFTQDNVKSKYYEQVFDLRSDTDQDIYLAPESFVTAVSENGDSHINGAIRVAFLELDKDGNEMLKYIWAPNSLIEYSSESNAFTNQGKVEANYYFQRTGTAVDVSSLTSGNANVAMISTGGNDCCGYNSQYKFMWSCGNELPENAPSLTTIRVEDGADFGYKQIKIRVWLEGHDRECVSLLSNQKFTMNFQFDAQRGE